MPYSSHLVCACVAFLAWSQTRTSRRPSPFWVSACVSVRREGLFIRCHPAVNQIPLPRLNLFIYQGYDDQTEPSLRLVHRSAVKLKDMPKQACAHTPGIAGKDSSGRKTVCVTSQPSLHQLIGVFVCAFLEGKKRRPFTHRDNASKLSILCPLTWLESIPRVRCRYAESPFWNSSHSLAASFLNASLKAASTRTYTRPSKHHLRYSVVNCAGMQK